MAFRGTVRRLAAQGPLHHTSFLTKATTADTAATGARALPDVVAHRGASGKLPGHTLPAYEEAVKAGADWIELDVHSSRDGHLMITHDIDLSLTTNVEELFPERKRKIYAPCIDGEAEEMNDFFVQDFDKAELEELTVVHQFIARRARDAASGGAWSDRGVDLRGDVFKVPTVVKAAASVQAHRDRLKSIQKGDGLTSKGALQYSGSASQELESGFQKWRAGKGPEQFDVLVQKNQNSGYSMDVARMVQKNPSTGFERAITRDFQAQWFFQADENPDVGLYIETKRPSHYARCGLKLEERLVSDIEASGFDGPIIIQSFERESLEIIAALKPEWIRVQLLLADSAPGGERAAPNRPPREDDEDGMLRFMETIASYANGVGPHKTSIVPHPSQPPLRSALIEAAHRHNLLVHPYTFRTDVQFLPSVYAGNASLEFMRFFELGVDGVFADFPSHAVFARQMYEQRLQQP